ncbi:hypothetical protein ABZX85_34030 [Streptomyces sp. NPDC004539]|uniref:hypothetical protein n=1 Tax=Streptomyces sp. NPDC004539 TaxID=3154280 RepID=UPI00339F1B6C
MAIILLGAVVAAAIMAAVFWEAGRDQPAGERVRSALGAGGSAFTAVATVGLLVVAFLT